MTFSKFGAILRSETTPAQPALWLANHLGRLLPTGTGGRLRTHLYRVLGIRVGRGTVFHGAATFSGHRGRKAEITIGARCRINSPVHFDATAPIIIGSNVSIGHHVIIITAGHEIGPPVSRAGKHCPAPVAIGNGAWIGANVTLLPGVRIGEGAVVAASATVHRDVLPNTLVGGVPARLIRKLPAESSL